MIQKPKPFILYSGLLILIGIAIGYNLLHPKEVPVQVIKEVEKVQTKKDVITKRGDKMCFCEITYGSGSVDPNEYQINAIVSQLSRGPVGALNVKGSDNTTEIKTLRKYKLWGLFPTNISQIDLSYNNENEIEEFSVDLQVQWWEAYDETDAGVVI